MEKRCFNCMEPFEGGVCPNCSFDEGSLNTAENSKAGTLLKNRYYLGNIFSKSIDSTVYIAYDNELQKKVYVREFTGKGIAELTKKNRPEELVQRFLNYAKSTATISLNDILPRTVDTFAEESVGYLVTDYFEGESLKTLLGSGIKISASNAIKIAKQILKGLKSIHNSGLIFGAISPETLYVLKNGQIRLFGLVSSFYDFTDDLDCRVELLNPSYAAPELFDSTAKKGVWCDVYSVAAILYRLLTNTIPAISFLRSGGENLVSPGKLDKSIPKNIQNALLNALNWQTEKRTSAPEGFLEELSAKKVKRRRSGAMLWANILGFFQGMYDKSASKKSKPEKASKADENTGGEDTDKEKIRLLWLWITIPAVILIVLIVVLLLLFLPSSQNNGDTSSASTSSEDIWYYGSGVETPGTGSEYVYGGYSSKTSSSSKQNNTVSKTVSNDPNAVECPDLAGYTLSQAKAVLESNHLLLGEIHYDYSNDYPVDFVMAQSMKSGGMVQKGSKIDLVVCKGPVPAEVELPDVAGMDMKTAAEQITAAGFTNIEYNFFLSDDAPGTVTDASFKTNGSASHNSVVVITVSGEKAEILDYSGKTVAEARSASPDINFVYKAEDGTEIHTITDAGASAYVVVSQDVSAGNPAYKGMTVTLTVRG